MFKLLQKMLMFGLLLMLVACSASRPLPSPYYSIPVFQGAGEDTESSWWAYRFRVNWPEDMDDPDFAVDLYLAHNVLKPVLEKNSEKISWWRFHRRATRSAPGHQFSFLFYCNSRTAKEIITEIDNNTQLAAAKRSGIIVNTVSSDTSRVEKQAIDSYSDSSWSVEIQRAWPSYIMGVSAFWLALIDEIDQQLDTTPDDGATEEQNIMQTEIEHYRRVDEKIAEMWQYEGQHALLHHLSAVFGYKPMLFKKSVIY